MMAMQEQDIQHIIAKAKSINASLDMHPSRPLPVQMTQMRPPTVSFAPASAGLQASVDFYKDKYIQGMEERLLLHNQNVQKDAEIKQRESELFAILEYIQKLQAELQGEQSGAGPANLQSTLRETPLTSFSAPGSGRPSPMAFVDPSPPASAPSSSTLSSAQSSVPVMAKEEPQEKEDLTAWVDVLKIRLPDFEFEPQHFTEIIRCFLNKHNLMCEMVESNIIPGLKFVGIPYRLEGDLIQQFQGAATNSPVTKRTRGQQARSPTSTSPHQLQEQLDYSIRPVVTPVTSSSVVAMPSNTPHEPKIHVVKGTQVIIWSDLLPVFLSESTVAALRKDSEQLSRIRSGIIDFLGKKLPMMGLTLNGTKVSGQLTIPKTLEKQFRDWFKKHHENQFMDYSTASSSGSKSKPAQKRKAEDPEVMDDRPKTRRSKPDEEDQPSLAINQPIRKASGASMTRYNVILKSILPTYNSMPKESRMDIKGKVKQFLIDKVGSEEKLSDCIIWVRSNDQLFSTYGVPVEWELDFKRFVVQEMRREFGDATVPVQPWE